MSSFFLLLLFYNGGTSPRKSVTVDTRNATVTLTGNDDRGVCDGLWDEDVSTRDRHTPLPASTSPKVRAPCLAMTLNCICSHEDRLADTW